MDLQFILNNRFSDYDSLKLDIIAILDLQNVSSSLREMGIIKNLRSMPYSRIVRKQMPNSVATCTLWELREENGTPIPKRK